MTFYAIMPGGQNGHTYFKKPGDFWCRFAQVNLAYRCQQVLKKLIKVIKIVSMVSHLFLWIKKDYFVWFFQTCNLFIIYMRWKFFLLSFFNKKRKKWKKICTSMYRSCIKFRNEKKLAFRSPSINRFLFAVS